MRHKNRSSDPGIDTDPFGEHKVPLLRSGLQLLGGRFRFDSNSPALLQIIETAYADLPRHRFRAKVPDFRITLLLSGAPPARAARRAAPPPLSMLHGAGFLGGTTAASTFTIIAPGERSAIVCVPPSLLEFPYHTRYELIEFTVFTLACRAQGLVPLHAACVGLRNRAVLLMGASGAGKSTVALHCLFAGMQFLAEDSVFVDPVSLKASGVANFLHVREESLQWLSRSRDRAMIRRSPVIRRRSGVAKFEVDLRRAAFHLAPTPLKIVAVAFLSAQSAGARPLLRSLSNSELTAQLREQQGYGASLPQWRAFSRKLSQLGGFELKRGKHPQDSVAALQSLLD